ncbi:ATP-binding protein, partial [Streptomyces griseorubiginosus]|uniref:ATP-binding protein n=1 Tax=Streptomyces griseorubiginosus TaxID=67304 RepID=UPI001AD7ACCC
MSARRERGSHIEPEVEALAVVWSELQPVAAHDIAPGLCVRAPAAGAVRPCLRQVWQLPGRSEHTPRQARTLVGGICRRWRVARRVVDDLLVIVSELVTNAVVHAPGEHVTVAVVLTATDVGVAVIDQGPRRPLAAHVAEAEDEHGRGLFLVEALADRHGAQPAEGGTAVWACLTLPPPRPLTHSAPP